ncbi:MAG: glutamate 5-kinase [Luteolibacter sp.]
MATTKTNRIVVKVGSSILSDGDRIAQDRLDALAGFISEAKKSGKDVILVTSAAVASGATALSLDHKVNISKKALAAVGQPILMSHYERAFAKVKELTAQILLTEEDFDSRKRTQIFAEIIDKLLANNIIPIVNENDISTTADQVFGDNDRLSAHVAHYTESPLLIILSDIDGLYDKNPTTHSDAKLIAQVSNVSDEMIGDIVNVTGEFASGGMRTKLVAARFLLQRGRRMFLANGFDLDSAREFLLNDRQVSGTIFENDFKPLSPNPPMHGRG